MAASGVAARALRREVGGGEHEQPGGRVGIAVFALIYRPLVRRNRLGGKRIVRSVHSPSVARAPGLDRSGSLIGVRILLAALRCEKGAVRENLTEHERVLREARDAGCALAVFPEMSLTGSVDPSRHPERLVALDDPAVVAMAELTADTGVAAVFGISERAERGVAHITQVVAEGGRVLGVQRKRHLGDDEVAYRAADTDEVFDLRDARVAIAICAEGEVERPFAFAEAAGAPLVLFSAAPGLYGRRIDEAAWRRGWDWWRGHGLGDACRHAREHRLWIAIATQAGPTRDEDFPGLAALVDPEGTVRAELPDWHAGALVVDVPL